MLQNMFLQGPEKEQEEGTHYNISRGRYTRAHDNYSYSFGKENGDLQSRKQCFDEGKRMYYRTQTKREKNMRKQKGGCTQAGRRVYTGRKENVHTSKRKNNGRINVRPVPLLLLVEYGWKYKARELPQWSD